MAIEKINTQLTGLPPTWMSRVTSRGTTTSNAFEIRKILGEPIPQAVDPKLLAPHIAAMFRKNGLLERLRKKLALISRKKGGQFIPAKNTIAAVDDDDNIYVGVDFLQAYADDEDLIAGILAHEWGHMLSDERKANWSHLTWDELFALRREEEASADAFAGRALFLLRSPVEPLISFLKKIDQKRKKLALPNHKYHNTATRIDILRGCFLAAEQAMDLAKRIFTFAGRNGPKIGHIIGSE